MAPSGIVRNVLCTDGVYKTLERESKGALVDFVMFVETLIRQGDEVFVMDMFSQLGPVSRAGASLYLDPAHEVVLSLDGQPFAAYLFRSAGTPVYVVVHIALIVPKIDVHLTLADVKRVLREIEESSGGSGRKY